MSNFAFLQAEWPLLFEAATQAEGMANTDARASCFYSRRALELTVAWLYTYDKTLKLPYQDHLSLVGWARRCLIEVLAPGGCAHAVTEQRGHNQ